MRIRLLALLAVLSYTYPVFAGPDGRDVLRACQQTIQHLDERKDESEPDALGSLESGWCIGWVTAAIEMNNLQEGMADKEHPLRANMFHFCAPRAGLTSGQAIRIVVKYLKDHPKDLDQNGIALTMLALMSAFPCKAT